VSPDPLLYALVLGLVNVMHTYPVMSALQATRWSVETDAASVGRACDTDWAVHRSPVGPRTVPPDSVDLLVRAI
jgi:hypothetical protein